MAQDKRELVLTKVLDILGTVDGFVNVWRDREAGAPRDPATQAALLPAAILLDGKEVVRIPTMGKAVGRGVPPATVFTLLPQVWVILLPRDDITNTGIAGELSTFRVKILKAILTNGELALLLGANGEIEYRGCETDMQTGSTLEGQMSLDFAFSYVLDPRDL